MLEEGRNAPEIVLPDQNGDEKKLSDFLGKKVVLYFYPRDDTPGCTIQAKDFRDNIEKIRKLNAEIIGISNDSVASHKKFVDKYDLNFTLLADVDKKVVNEYGVYRPKKFIGREFLGIVRSTFVVDENGKIMKVFPKVNPKKSISEVLEVLK